MQVPLLNYKFWIIIIAFYLYIVVLYGMKSRINMTREKFIGCQMKILNQFTSWIHIGCCCNTIRNFIENCCNFLWQEIFWNTAFYSISLVITHIFLALMQKYMKWMSLSPKLLNSKIIILINFMSMGLYYLPPNILSMWLSSSLLSSS